MITIREWTKDAEGIFGKIQGILVDAAARIEKIEGRIEKLEARNERDVESVDEKIGLQEILAQNATEDIERHRGALDKAAEEQRKAYAELTRLRRINRRRKTWVK